MLDLLIDFGVLCTIPIVKGRILSRKGSIALKIAELHCLAYIPDLEKLIFGVGCQIDAISLARNMTYALCMPYEDTCRSVAI